MTAVNGASSLFSPVIGILLYHWMHPSPYLITAGILAILGLIALRHPVLRRLRDRPTEPVLAEEEMTAPAP